MAGYADRSKIVEAYCRDFPALGSLTIARQVLAEHPGLYSSLEVARGAVRYLRRASGRRNAAKVERSGRTLYRQIPNSEPPRFKMVSLPEGPKHWLILADIHLPDHDEKALEIAINHGRKAKCDAVLYLGDLPDCDALKKAAWRRNPNRPDFGSELDAIDRLLDYVQDELKPRKTVWKCGNHEDRLDSYLALSAIELMRGLPVGTAASFRQYLCLDSRGIQWVDSICPIIHKQLVILHGHELGKGAYSPINPARTAWLKTKSCAVVGHWHRTSSQPEQSLIGRMFRCWSVGCLSNLHPEYAPVNEWNHGFGILHSTEDWRIENLSIIHGKVF